MYDFHRYTEEGNDENGHINRNNENLKYHCCYEGNKVSILHYDLIQDFSTHLSQFKNTF
jgi:hypothetical protein